jgi:hypothetical protein
VARPRSPAIALRNDQMYAEWKSGRNLAWLADRYERTPQQIGRIIAAFHPDLEDEDDRALHRGRLESLYEQVQGIFEAPGWKMSPTGQPAMGPGPDPEPAEDVMAKIEAAKLTLQVLESMRKLDGRDKQAKKDHQQPYDEARAAMLAALAAERVRMEGMQLAGAERRELEALRQIAGRPPVVQGEVVHELRSGQQRGGD